MGEGGSYAWCVVNRGCLTIDRKFSVRCTKGQFGIVS